jgi:hypothetical protein
MIAHLAQPPLGLGAVPPSPAKLSGVYSNEASIRIYVFEYSIIRISLNYLTKIFYSNTKLYSNIKLYSNRKLYSNIRLYSNMKLYSNIKLCLYILYLNINLNALFNYKLYYSKSLNYIISNIVYIS